MKSLFAWQWTRRYMPNHVAKQRNVHVKIFDVALSECCRDRFPDFEPMRRHDVCLITGDSKILADDVKAFNSWNIDHDIFAVNRSLIFHQRPVMHWAAVDVEEATWFTGHINNSVDPDHKIVRHTIGEEYKSGNPLWPGMFDCYWEMKYAWENELQRTVFMGNSGYFAVLVALKMGYKKVIIAGMPLDTGPHFYESDDTPGPLWTAMTYMQWMDFKTKVPASENVRSMSGYSAFILGQADRNWLC